MSRAVDVALNGLKKTTKHRQHLNPRPRFPWFAWPAKRFERPVLPRVVDIRVHCPEANGISAVGMVDGSDFMVSRRANPWRHEDAGDWGPSLSSLFQEQLLQMGE